MKEKNRKIKKILEIQGTKKILPSGGVLENSLRVWPLNQVLRIGVQSFQDYLYTYEITEKKSRVESIIHPEFPPLTG